MSTANEFIIQTDDLVKKFGDTTAVAGLNMGIDSGELFGLVGPG